MELTKRELEVLRLICEGLSNVQIGERLGVSTATIRSHHKSILKKLKVNKTILLVRIAMENGWLN